MAVYFANKIAATRTGISSPTLLAWSRHVTDRKGPANGSPLVAVAFESGAVGVYTGRCFLDCPLPIPREHACWFVVFVGWLPLVAPKKKNGEWMCGLPTRVRVTPAWCDDRD